MKDVQGDILGAIKKFDDLYNKGSSNNVDNQKDKNEKKRLKDNRKKEKDDKKKKKPRQESLVSKVPQPAVTHEFQAKNTGNGGNATTLAMEKMLAAR